MSAARYEDVSQADTYEIGQHDAKVDASTEDACTESSNRLWRNFGDIYGCNNDSLPDALSGEVNVDSVMQKPRPAHFQ